MWHWERLTGINGRGMVLTMLLFSVLAPTILAHDPSPPAPEVALPPLPRKPSPVHTPLVATPAPHDAPGYRDQLKAIAEKYTHLYYAADLRSARDEALRGLALAEKARNAADEAQFLKPLGYVNWLLGDTAAALDYEQRLLILADTLNDDRLRAIAHRTLGTVYRQIGEVAKGRQHTETALSFAERASDEGLRIGALNNLAVFALDAGDLTTARRLHEQVLVYREQQGERWDIAGAVSNLADVATAEGKLPEALALHERALSIRQEIGDQRGIVRSLRQVADSLRVLGRTDEALARLDEALTRAQKITGHELLRDTWQEITLTREARGEFAAALAAERQAGQAREGLAGERARTRIAELETRFEDTRKQNTIERLEREQRLQATELRAQQAELARIRLRNLLLATSLAGGALLLGSIIWMQRARLRAEHRARDAAERADALKTQLLQMVSHDIRGPAGNIQVMAEDWRDESPAHGRDQRVELILHEAQHVHHLAQDLLDAAALEAGGLTLQHDSVSLTEITRSTLGYLETTAAKKEQKLTFTSPPGDPAMVRGDATRLIQVVRNLVSNALKYSPRHSTVHISLQRHVGFLQLAVQDEGPGIPAEQIPRLFLPFSRLAAKPTGGESSHGLGLSIVHDLVKLHGGRIRVEPAPAGGTTFIVELPAHA